MKFNKDLVSYSGEEVYYDSVKLSITRQNIQDYVLQTSMNPEPIILFYYKKELSQIRDKQLEQILNDRERQNKVD
jgi:hypothetical protein